MERPAGDPGALRAEAARLEREADGLRANVLGIPEVPSATFLGPAGDRLRNHLSDLRSEGLRAVGLLTDAASILRSEAGALQARIDAWDAEQRRLAAQRAAGQHR